jgi:hypothetical protein
MLQPFKEFFDLDGKLFFGELVLVLAAVAVPEGVHLGDGVPLTQPGPVAVPVGDDGAAPATLCASATGGEEGEASAHQETSF